MITFRRQSCVLAVQNARVKALEIANSLNQNLGQARQIHEQAIEEYTGRVRREKGEGSQSEGRSIERTETFQELIKSATVTVATKVFVAFELKVRSKKMTK
jgi:uncharacterized protein YggE